MKMRERPIRGKKYRILSTGQEVVALEPIENTVKVILPNDEITAIQKTDLSLAVIDTKNYEKFNEPNNRSA